MTPERTLVAWCPDWPVTAAGVGPDVAAAVFRANRVVACSAAARAEGVRRGLRRREAQARCPELVVLADEPGRDARAFEPVVVAMEALATRVEVVRPGVCALGSRGPSRYFGGDEALAARVVQAVQAVQAVTASPGRPGCRVGVADGPFAAGLAARAGVVVAPGGAAAFLAPFPTAVLGRPELVDILGRLGIWTLGDLAALPAPDVLARFGPTGRFAHRLARGLDRSSVAARTPPPDLAVQVEMDPPAERVDTAAFAAKARADQLADRLTTLGLACTRLAIEAETGHGEVLVRLWRHDGALSPAAMADRVRWQLDGWLSGTVAGPQRPTAGITLLRLRPDQVVPDTGRQLGFWGGTAEAAERVGRALARVQGLLGPEAVVTAVPSGGRHPVEQVTLVPWGDGSGPGRSPEPPWPGRLPAPTPATVFSAPLPAAVLDADGQPAGVTGRAVMTAAPASVSVGGRRSVAVVAWAGPWPTDERWWDRAAHRRRARFQVITADGSAWLLALEAGRWWAEAVYD
ncbi:MAG: DNA polymerase Y family protein [Acidimicrobiales bacterium]